MSSTDIAFPRGGELLAEIKVQNSLIKSTVKRRKQNDKESGETASKKSRDNPEYDTVFTKFLTKELLTEDVRALGIVKKIRETDVILETTNGLRVRLDARAISSEFKEHLGETTLDEIFEVGQALAFKVVKAPKQKGEDVFVTIDPAALNCHLVHAAFKNALVVNGSVVSVEDKGAVINVGLPKVTGFVKNDDLPPQWKLDRLQIGQVLLFRVRRNADVSRSQRVLELSAFADMDVYSSENFSLSDLMPGTIVTVEPEKVVQTGVFGTLKNGTKVYLNKSYLPVRIRLDPGRFIKPIRATVICTLPNSHFFVLSAHPDIVASSKPERRQLSDETRPGQFIKCTVYDVDKLGQVHFTLGENEEKPQLLTAIMTRAQFDDYDNEIGKFEPGSTHKCRVVAYRSLDRMLLVSTRKEMMNQKVVELGDLCPGERANVVVNQIRDNGLIVKLGTKGEGGGQLLGFIPCNHVLDETRGNWKNQFKVGTRLSCRVLSFNDEKQRLYLTAKPSLVNSYYPVVTEIKKTLVGEIVVGMIFNPFESGAFLVQFYNNVAGFLPANEAKMLDDPREGDVITAKIANVDLEKRRILLTFRDDDTRKQDVSKNKLGNGAVAANKEKLTHIKRPAKPFQICQARVVGPWRYGKTSPHTTAELQLQGGTIGRLHVSELDLSKVADGESPMTEFLHKHLQKSVEVKVICVGNRKTVSKTGKVALEKKCGTTRFVDCTMIPSKIAEPFRKLRLINFQTSFERGERVPLFIGDSTQILKEGLDYAAAEVNPLFSARIPKFYINRFKSKESRTDKELLPMVDDAAFKFANGELHRGIVISQERTARFKTVNIALGDAIIKEENGNVRALESSQKRKKGHLRNLPQAGDNDMEVEAKASEAGLQDPGFDFSLGMFSMANMTKAGKQKQVVDNDVEATTTVENAKNESENNKEQSLLQRKRCISESERQLCEAISEEPIDFDRWLTVEPNSSNMWIKYITHFLSEGKVAEARKVAEWALNVIDRRHEVERFNVWTAYLNLEVLYGDSDSLKTVFNNAVNAMDPLKMHKQMVKILTHHKRNEDLDELFESMIKRFRHEDLEIWFAYGTYLYESKRIDEARALLQKALDSLSRKHHLNVLSRFAQMEYRFADKERGKTMFEKILQTYPKKTDIWSVYMDMSLKYDGIVESRQLFKRVVTSDPGAYRLRIFYDKWLKAEERYGDEESVEMVREHINELFPSNQKNNASDDGEKSDEE